MRRKYLGLAIAAITAFGPASAFGGDREIAQEIMTRLKSQRDSGALKDFSLDMKVDQGVVLFRGKVSEKAQKQVVLQAADGVDGIRNVVDQVTVVEAQTKTADAAKPQKVVVKQDDVSLRDMLTGNEPTEQPAADASETQKEEVGAVTENTFVPTQPLVARTPEKTAELEIAPGDVRPTAAVELAAPAPANDQQVVSGVVTALGKAQQSGQLKGFGVDVQCQSGVVSLKGRAASKAQVDQIVRIAQGVPGVQGVEPQISVISAPTPQQGIPAQMASNRMTPVRGNDVPVMAAPYRSNQPARVSPTGVPVHGAPTMGANTMGAPVMGQPVPMNGGMAAGAPRYDSPNFAALTYPQQYSPSAWPYIGPFYPYPQVPLGWRKVSLEWDDGWWFLDFTDR